MGVPFLLSTNKYIVCLRYMDLNEFRHLHEAINEVQFRFPHIDLLEDWTKLLKSYGYTQEQYSEFSRKYYDMERRMSLPA